MSKILVLALDFSEILYRKLQEAGQTGELYTYPGDNHNISNSFGQAMTRTIEFYDRYLKGIEWGDNVQFGLLTSD